MTSNPEGSKVVALDRKQQKPRKDGPAWLRQCVLGETGKPLAVLASARAALRAVMPHTFKFDEMLQAAVLIRSLEDEPGFEPRLVTDVDVGFVQDHLQHLGLKRVAEEGGH